MPVTRMVFLFMTDGWSVGSLLSDCTGTRKKLQGRSLWVRYYSKETGTSEDWLHDCNDCDYAKFWFMLVKEGSKKKTESTQSVGSAVTLPGMTRRGTCFGAETHKRQRTNEPGLGDDDASSKRRGKCAQVSESYSIFSSTYPLVGICHHPLHSDTIPIAEAKNSNHAGLHLDTQ